MIGMQKKEKESKNLRMKNKKKVESNYAQDRNNKKLKGGGN